MTPPAWLTVLAVLALAVAFLSAAYILWDIVRCRRQIMTVMKWVWPITALYLGPLAIWAHRRLPGRHPLADRLRGRTVRLDSALLLRLLPPRPAPRPPGLLVHDADRDGDRLRDCLPDELVADQARPQGEDVGPVSPGHERS